MIKLKLGQELKVKGEPQITSAKVKLICEGGALISGYFKDWMTNQEIEDTFILPKEKWSPKENELYFFITGDGVACRGIWHNYQSSNDYKDFLGVYETKELCEQAIEKIKGMLNNEN